MPKNSRDLPASPSPDKLQGFIASLPGMVCQIELLENGSVIFPYVSKGCSSLLDINPEDLQADASYFLNLIHPEDIPSFLDTLKQSAHTHNELVDARKQAHEAESKIQKLEQELAQVSELVHEDQLTGALNRRGLDAAFEREASSADRRKLPLCVALLDIDDFKHLNDSLGHQAGDQALIHLSGVIQDALRPSDSVTRYGGEEFVILLPDAELKGAVEAIERLQRELTKKFFLHNNERILVTFSAGVAQRAMGEAQEDVLGRADKAMYHAKKTGKNRVATAEE